MAILHYSGLLGVFDYLMNASHVRVCSKMLHLLHTAWLGSIPTMLKGG